MVLPLQMLCHEHANRFEERPAMRQKTSHIRGIRAALVAAGSSIHPSLVPGTVSWFWALAAAILFGGAGTLAPARLRHDEVES
jgi:hypothetical protein